MNVKRRVQVVLSHLILLPILIGVVWLTTAIVNAQGSVPTQVTVPVTVPTSDILPNNMTRDLWFWIFVGWYVFSAMVSGMPEPEAASSPWYIWAYRSLHLLSASGTSFFQNKMYWPSSVTRSAIYQEQIEVRGKPSSTDLP